MYAAPSSRFSAPVLALLALTACSEAEDDGVTYHDDVKPLLDQRCVFCHQPGAPNGPTPAEGVDIADPFAEVDGLVNANNLWKQGHPELDSPERIVTPGDPEESFLIDKISDPELGRLPEGAGSPMPFQLPPITADELELVEQWVSAGAHDDTFFRCQVYPIFFSWVSRADAAACGRANDFTPGVPRKCETCHFAGTPNAPDLTDPFGPRGIVGVPSDYRSDLLRVDPGSPDSSLLVQKLRLSRDGNQPNSPYGSPMPKPVLPLSTEQVEVVRQWISEGARP